MVYDACNQLTRKKNVFAQPPDCTADRGQCYRLQSNEGRVWLSVMANNLGILWPRLVLAKRTGNRSLTSLQQRLVKTGGRLVKRAGPISLASAGGKPSD